MQAAVRAILVLAAAATLAACGTVAAPVASGHRAHPGGMQAAADRHGPPAGNRAEAGALARLMLSRLRLPAGARRLLAAPVPAGGLWAGAATSLDLHQQFMLRQPIGTVTAALRTHPLPGMSLPDFGTSGVRTRVVLYTPLSVPAGVSAVQLVLAVAPAKSGGSLVRADAQVIWFPPRTAAEYIDPAQYHVLTIAVTIYSPRQHTIHRVVTSHAAITRLAKVLNESQVAPPDKLLSCPMTVASYQLAFAVSRHSRPAVVVTATNGPCEGAQVSVGGRAQPALQNENAVVATADALLGIVPQP
jgi:hypothetical protein